MRDQRVLDMDGLDLLPAPDDRRRDRRGRYRGHGAARSIEEFVSGLSPRQELVRRWALMDVFRACARDCKWKRQVNRLLKELRLSEDAVIGLVDEANRLAGNIRREIHSAGLNV